jgi:hypothetical protein
LDSTKGLYEICDLVSEFWSLLLQGLFC